MVRVIRFKRTLESPVLHKHFVTSFCHSDLHGRAFIYLLACKALHQFRSWMDSDAIQLLEKNELKPTDMTVLKWIWTKKIVFKCTGTNRQDDISFITQKIFLLQHSVAPLFICSNFFLNLKWWLIVVVTLIPRAFFCRCRRC